ncbi:MAG: aminopeptidase, partial [Actinobacteria bacterium]|nr:aminopeptidase [Actinomycetota bacterium]
MDPRIVKLAKTLVSYSCRIKIGEKVMVECYGTTAYPLLKEVIRTVYRAGGFPFCTIKDNS